MEDATISARTPLVGGLEMAQRKTLTEKQVAILRWIADGCPEGVMDDTLHRISAGALRNRGLVTTTGRGPTWSAKATAAGRDYLREVDGPNPPVPREANVSVTQQLVNELVAAGGTMRVPRRNWHDRDAIDYEQRAHLAIRYRRVPAGKRLVIDVFRDELELRLVDAPDTNEAAELVPVQVPERVSRYHAVARTFRDRSERHEVSRTQLQRAVRIVHTIATEAERRGWAALAGTESEDGYGRTSWTAPKDGHIQLVARDNQFLIRLQEEGVHTRGPWEAEVHRYRNVGHGYLLYGDREAPSGPYDANATGTLRLELYFRHKGRQSRWSDRRSWTLEERLPHLFREIEERIADAVRIAEERRVAAEKAAETARQEAEERERQWHLLMDQAKRRLVETHRASELLAQARAWNQADQLRQFCDALTKAHGDDPRTAEWLEWAREHAARLDPLTEPPAMPDPPEETPEALQEHLPEGWSVHGPEHGYRTSPWTRFNLGR